MNERQEPIALIADDDPAIRDFLGTLLRLEGLFLNVAVAADRDNAMSLALEHKPRLILMDYTMPGLAAEQFVVRVRSELPASVVVLMTSAHFVEQKAGELGLKHYLSKPFDVCMLRELLRACVRNGAVPAA